MLILMPNSRYRTVVGIVFATGSALITALTGCATLWDGFGETNPQSCLVTPSLCSAEEYCNPATNQCEIADGGSMPPDPGVDLGELPTKWALVPSDTTVDLRGVWGLSLIHI